MLILVFVLLVMCVCVLECGVFFVDKYVYIVVIGCDVVFNYFMLIIVVNEVCYGV